MVGAELVVDLFVSVDGWAGGDNLPGYFGYFGQELAQWIAREQAVPETVVVGRRTYDAFRALPEEVWKDDREHLMLRDKVVFSRALGSVAWPNTQVRHDLVPDMRKLKSQGDQRLRTWGSMSLVSQLVAAGMVDRLRLMRFPLLAGEAGRQPAFAEMGSTTMELLEHRALDDRIILEEYRPTGDAIPRA